MDHTDELHEEMKNSRWLPSAPEQFLFHYKGEPGRVFSAEFKMGLKYVIHKVPGDGAFYGHQTELNVNTWVDNGEWVVVASGNHFDEPDVEKLQDRIKELESQIESKGNQWISMDTAPKPSIKILLKFEGGEVSVGYWDLYYAEGGRGFEGGQAWIEPLSGERLDLNFDPPIGWMSLPTTKDI